MKILVALLGLVPILFSPALAHGQASFKSGSIGGAVMLPDGRTFVVSIPLEGTLIYYDAVDDKELRKVEVDFQPAALACQGETLFASTKGSAAVHLLDAKTGKESGEVKLAGDPVLALACHPEKGLVYATNMTHEVVVIDPKERKAYPTKARGQMIAVDPVDGQFVYTGIQGAIKDLLVVRRGAGGSATISRASTGERASLLKYAVEGHDLKLEKSNDNAASNGKAIAVSSDGKKVAMVGGGGWMPKTGRGRAYVVPIFDTEEMQDPIGQIEVGAFPTGLAFHPKENLGAAFHDARAGEIILFNPKSAVRKGAIAVSSRAWAGNIYLGFTGDGKKVITASLAGLTKEAGEVIFYPVDLAGKPKEAAPAPEAKKKAEPKPKARKKADSPAGSQD